MRLSRRVVYNVLSCKKRLLSSPRENIKDAPTLKDFLLQKKNTQFDIDNNSNNLPLTKGLKFHIETYGCQMNTSDSEIVRSILASHGHIYCDDLESADLILTNTCAIRENAENKVWHRLSVFKSIRAKNKKIRRSGYPLVGEILVHIHTCRFFLNYSLQLCLSLFAGVLGCMVRG